MQSHPADLIINSLATRQHGVVARRQLRERDVTAGFIRRRIGQGMLEPLTSRVLVVTGSADTIERRLLAAVLEAGPGATLSHRTAAWRWGFTGFEPEPVDVTGRRSRTSQVRADLSVIHQPRRLFPAHVTEVHGIATTTPTRTLFDLANNPRANPGTLERLLDRAWAARLVDHWTIKGVLEDLAGRGRTGITLMRELLAQRGPAYVAAQTNLEDRFRDILGYASAQGFRAQVNIANETSWIGRVDFVHERLRIIVEVDSITYHTTITDRTHDRRREQRLEAAGWLVVRIRERDLWHDPSSVVAQVRTARSTASGRQIAS